MPSTRWRWQIPATSSTRLVAAWRRNASYLVSHLGCPVRFSFVAIARASTQEVTYATTRQFKRVPATDVLAKADAKATSQSSARRQHHDAAPSPGQAFLNAFGEQGGVWFAEGKTFAEAQALNQAESKAKIGRLEAEVVSLTCECNRLQKRLAKYTPEGMANRAKLRARLR